MPDKVKGTVKWFSNRKGFGFITPTSDNAPTQEDIFVYHQNIVTEKETYRTLKDGFEVEFEVITDTNGKLKAENVTSADGSPCPGPEPRERRKRKKNKGSAGNASAAGESGEENLGGETGGEKSNVADDAKPKEAANEKPKGKGRRRNNGKKKEEAKTNSDNKPPPRPSWEDDLEESVKNSLESREVKIVGGKAYLAIGEARVKLGNGGYAAFAHTSGMIAEGNFSCENNGKITATWNHVIKLDGSDWKATTVEDEKEVLLSEIDLNDDSVNPTKQEDATKPVWGEGKTDPREALENNGFQLRKASFSHVTRRRRPNNRGRRNNNGGGEQMPAAEAE